MSDRRGAAAALELRAIVRTYQQAGVMLPVLRGVALTLWPGEIAALVGPSGAGKSTLLHTAGLLERPDGGEVLLGGRDCGGMSDGQRTEIRRAQLGFVYQFHHLLAPTIARRGSPAASSSASPWSAPSPTARASCSATSPPAISTSIPPRT